jgi:endonuclease YncB( thermonuclease family)
MQTARQLSPTNGLKEKQEARARKVGLWQKKNPMPPWEFRHHPQQ